MEIQKYLESIPVTLSSTAHVKTIFGDPVEAHGRTIIPVARVQFGFGAGSGGGATGEGSERKRQGEGGGGGGGVLCLPLGIVEISAGETRFLPIRRGTRRRMAAAALAGFILGWLVLRR
ncbi:MAG TPA: spore germination protein GerW family protein [Terriglobales bacterium]|nr:spore germination protein GerW family protein [Terriglobales bacterium]